MRFANLAARIAQVVPHPGTVAGRRIHYTPPTDTRAEPGVRGATMAQRHGTMLFTVAPDAAATTSPYGPMPAQPPAELGWHRAGGHRRALGRAVSRRRSSATTCSRAAPSGSVRPRASALAEPRRESRSWREQGGTDGPHSSLRQLDPLVARGAPAQPCRRRGAASAQQGAGAVDPPALHARGGRGRRCGYSGECVAPASVRNRTGATTGGGGRCRPGRTHGGLPAEEGRRRGDRVRSQASSGRSHSLGGRRRRRGADHRVGRDPHQ